nr:hypothetical protein [Pseudomonas sichuanensis]
MKRTIAGLALAGEALIRDAIGAQRRYQEAQDAGAPPHVVERLRLLAASLHQAVTDYQLHASEKRPWTLH